jgi:hypothetical protein
MHGVLCRDSTHLLLLIEQNIEQSPFNNRIKDHLLEKKFVFFYFYGALPFPFLKCLYLYIAVKEDILEMSSTVSKSSNIFWHDCSVSKSDRQKLLKQKGCVVWITGLSGSGN